MMAFTDYLNELELFLKKDWDYIFASKSVKDLNKERFINEIKAIVLKNIQ